MNWWSGRRVLVTGGGGFVGQKLASRLLELGARVRVGDNLWRDQSAHQNLGAVEFLKSDLLRWDQCLDVCRDMDVVFHMASRVGPSSFYVQRPFEVVSTNILIDTQVLRAAVESGVTRYFYPSSVFVYPSERQRDVNALPLREDEALPANPPVSYGWAKIIGEQAVEFAVKENPAFRAAIGRLIGVYGPGQDIDLRRGSIIPVLLRRAFEYPKTPFSIWGNGEETRSYCYIDDVVDAMILCVEHLDQKPLIGPLNIGNEGSTRIIDLAREVIRISGKDIQIEFQPGQPAVWGQSIVSSAKAVLDGWEPKVTLEDGLRRTYSYVIERLQS